eukprot:gene5675-11453_t
MVLDGRTRPPMLAYVNASYGVHADCKSHTGGVISLSKGPIYVRSSKQKIVLKKMTGVSDMASKVILKQDFLLEQGYNMKPATMYQDNASTMHLIVKGISSCERTKRIGTRFFFKF